MSNITKNPHAGVGFNLTVFATTHLALDLSENLRMQLLTTPELDSNYNAGELINTLTLNAQYHIWPGRSLDPYFGVGLAIVSPIKNYGDSMVARMTTKTRVGWDVQFGVNYNMSEHFFMGLDAKKVWEEFATKGTPMSAAYLKLNPWIFALNFGWHF